MIYNEIHCSCLSLQIDPTKTVPATVVHGTKDCNFEATQLLLPGGRTLEFLLVPRQCRVKWGITNIQNYPIALVGGFSFV